MAEATVLTPLTRTQSVSAVQEHVLIARGLGRSYGDSAISPVVLQTTYLDHFLAFDPATGLLTCEEGVSIRDILQVMVPQGWFVPVTPGTSAVTVGGAIASDIHGKNHHVQGSFTDHVTAIELLLGTGESVTTSQAHKPDLFRATCGGIGLTGIILSATFRLLPIRSSRIVETTIKAPDLEAALSVFAEHANTTYSVAWIDCLAQGKHLGRSLVMLGEHAEEGALTVHEMRPLPVPFDMPTGLLNHANVKAFNTLYYGIALKNRHTRRIPFESFFYPLDALRDWNRLYGKQGFVQYQCVLPKGVGIKGLRTALERIAESGQGSFLAVLKVFGKGNGHPLSFPMEGYTLAFDFKAEPTAFQLMGELDKIVLDLGGRLYLTKDARMSESMFKTSYPRWQEFEEVRAKYGRWGSSPRFNLDG